MADERVAARVTAASASEHRRAARPEERSERVAAQATAVLERRYRRLLVAYPADYRAERGDELVATFLDGARPGRRTPGLADAADVVVGGVRRRLGTAAIAGLDGGLRVAAPYAVALAAGISAYAWWRVEPLPAAGGAPAFLGHFRTIGPVAFLAWLLVACGWLARRPGLARTLTGIAVATTLATPLLSTLTGYERPPLWVLMALVVFGLLALLGTSGTRPPTSDERIGVPAGAIAVAVAASTVVQLWPADDGGLGYYYRPTIARVGMVVAAAVAVVAAMVIRRRGAPEWLWATALLSLPAGWLGPFDSATLPIAVAPVPRFGRLAQVLLASCLAAAAMFLLARRRSAQPRRPTLETAGNLALGSVVGLGSFVLLSGLGVTGFVSPAGLPLRAGLSPHVLATLVVLLGAALLARGSRVHAPSALATLLGAWAVSAYDNGWRLAGWESYPQSMVLVTTIAFLPLTACAIAAARERSVPVLVLSVGWLGYVTLPFLLAWGPVLILLLACLLVSAYGRMKTC